MAPFVTLLGTTITGPTVKIQANPGPGLMVQCPPATTPSAASCQVVVDPTTFKKVGDVYRSAPIVLTLAPSSAAPTATSWSLRLESNDLADTPRVINLRYADTTDTSAPPAPVTVSAPDPTFVGTGRLQITTPTGASVGIAVKARAWNGNLVFFDETRQLSPSGKLVLSSSSQVLVHPFADSDVALKDTFDGWLVQKFASSPFPKAPATGNLSGSFQRAVYSDFYLGPASPFNQTTAVTFALAKTAPAVVGACTSDAQCTSGAKCDLGFCSTLPAYIPIQNPIPASLGPCTGPCENFTHKRMWQWGNVRGPNDPAHGYLAGPDQSGDSNLGGFLGLYASSSFYVTQVPYTSLRNGYRVHGPVATISGEPLADLISPSASVVATNLTQGAFAFLTQHDVGGGQSPSYLLRQCLYDLGRDPDGQTSVFDTFGGCINLGRTTYVLADRTTFQRGLQGWLQVHSFVEREGLEEIRLADGTSGVTTDTNQVTSPPPSFDQLLSAGESGLGLLMSVSASSGGAFQYYTGTDLANNVDYRVNKLQAVLCTKNADCNAAGSTLPTMICDSGSQTCKLRSFKDLPQHEQPVGVPALILETAASHLKLLEAYLNQIARQTYGQPADADASNGRQAALARFGIGMRLVLAAEQLATGINVKVPCVAGTDSCPLIALRFAAARDEMNVARTRVLAQADALANGRNPFNIPEDDVPLFFGDPTGTNSRYFAASDYLIDGWAAPAVAQTQASLDAARSAWIAKTQSVVQDELNQHNREEEINQLMSKYGAPILASCGNLQVSNGNGGIRLLDSTEVIPWYSDPSHVFSNRNCFVDAACSGLDGVDSKEALQSILASKFLDASGNLVAGDGSGASLAALTVRSEVCKISNIGYLPAPDNRFTAQMDAVCNHDIFLNPVGPPTVTFVSCSVVKMTDGNLYFQGSRFIGNTIVSIPLAALFTPIKRSDVGAGKFYAFASVGAAAAQDTQQVGDGPDDNIYNYRDYRTDSTTVFPYWVPDTRADTVAFNFAKGASFCSDGKSGRLTKDYPLPDRGLFAPSCYKGELGVAFHELTTNQLRVERAKEVLDNGQAGAKDSYFRCKNIDTHAAMLLAQDNDFNAAKTDYDTVSGIIGSGQKAASTGNVFAAAAVGASGIIMSIWGSAIDDQAAKLHHMELQFSRDEKSQACWDEYRAQTRALETAMTDGLIATSELNSQMTRFQNLQSDNLLDLQEGKANLQRENGSPVGSLSHTFWVDEKVEKFRKDLEWARRLTFMAMRAVEYEFQQSLPFRSDIVAATNPNQLDDVVRGLKQEQGSRTINRRRPEEASVVLSLRDDVLSLSDHTSLPAGERNWTPAQRFASRLWDSRYAVRDSKGNWLGQGVPFNVGPRDILETRCGERLWRATATLQGDGIEESAPGASVILMKRNTFSSQYCNGEGPPATDPTSTLPRFQIGAVHTTADLFQPGSSVDLSDTNQFTAAMLYPWFNIRKTDFYKTTFQDGSSDELAGRGLYGDYVLLFPKQMLDDTFELDRVEDVLLRLDYLSVDNLPQ